MALSLTGVHHSIRFPFFQPPPEGAGQRPGKTNTVCDAIRAAVVKVDPEAYLTTVLTSYLRSRPPKTDEALAHVLALFGSDTATAEKGTPGDSAAQHQDVEPSASTSTPESSTSATTLQTTTTPAAAASTTPTFTTSANSSERARAALKYMMLLMDVDALYEAALGSYNLAFALMVAQVAQKDPKEYLPFLQSLRQEPPHIGKYRIDIRLRRYARALQHLAAAGPDHLDTCLALAREHTLFGVLERAYAANNSPVLEAAACAAHAEVLQTQRSYAAAGALYERAGQPALAFAAYSEGLFWREAAGLAAQLGHDVAERQRHARQLAERLHTQQRPAEAAAVLEHHANDPEGAVVAYCTAHAWVDAMRLAAQANRADLIAVVVKPALTTALPTLASQHGELAALVRRHTARLQVVREERARQALLAAQGLLDETDMPGPEGDLFSDASSVRTSRASRSSASGGSSTGSRRSRTSTARSAKTRRKHEAKKTSLREGGAYEAEALVVEVHRLVGQIDAGGASVQAAAMAGIRLGLHSEAAALQRAHAAARAACRQSIPKVWTAEKKTAGSGPAEGMAGDGGAALSTNARVAAILAGQQDSAGVGSTASGGGGGGGEETAEDTVELPPRPALSADATWRLPLLDDEDVE